jgi:hypothetical protein
MHINKNNKKPKPKTKHKTKIGNQFINETKEIIIKNKQKCKSMQKTNNNNQTNQTTIGNTCIKNATKKGNKCINKTQTLKKTKNKMLKHIIKSQKHDINA